MPSSELLQGFEGGTLLSFLSVPVSFSSFYTCLLLNNLTSLGLKNYSFSQMGKKSLVEPVRTGGEGGASQKGCLIL